MNNRCFGIVASVTSAALRACLRRGIVPGPTIRHVQRAAGRRAPMLSRVAQEHADPRVLDPSSRAGMPTPRPGRLGPFLWKAGPVQRPRGARVRQALDNAGSQAVGVLTASASQRARDRTFRAPSGARRLPTRPTASRSCAQPAPEAPASSPPYDGAARPARTAAQCSPQHRPGRKLSLARPIASPCHIASGQAHRANPVAVRPGCRCCRPGRCRRAVSSNP